MTKTPAGKVSKQRSVDPGFAASSNPFDSDSDSEQNQTSKPARTSSAPVPSKANAKNIPSSYKNDFRDSGGLENQTVQELENYAVYKSEETTKNVNGCLKIAEEIREDATNTLITLHKQGEQITRTHMTAANIDHDLSMGEKLLGSLGGIFSKTWKPKKSRAITGPVITKDDSFKRRGSHLEQRERLGLSHSPKGKSNARQYGTASTALKQVEIEKAKQDDTLSDLSDVLGQLKGMAVDMGTEINRQNEALDHLHDDVDELNHRVKGANQRGRRLLGK